LINLNKLLITDSSKQIYCINELRSILKISVKRLVDVPAEESCEFASVVKKFPVAPESAIAKFDILFGVGIRGNVKQIDSLTFKLHSAPPRHMYILLDGSCVLCFFASQPPIVFVFILIAPS
jgi:hypothetical protein